MRHSPVAFNIVRTVVEDVELSGVVIPAGTFVILNTAAANRDPAVYDNPDRLDITRGAPPAMLTFAGGAHKGVPQQRSESGPFGVVAISLGHPLSRASSASDRNRTGMRRAIRGPRALDKTRSAPPARRSPSAT